MKQQLFLSLALLIVSLTCFAQPYTGTIFVDADIVTATDSSALVSVAYTGTGERTVFDRRVNEFITVNAFLFEVIWSDGLSTEAVVNPEFETIALATIEAEKYGWNIGQLPHCLRTDVDEIWIHKGVQLFGGGNNSILIHTGQTALYENDGVLEETLIHEAVHTSLDASHAASAGWLQAQSLDGEFISDYAEEFPNREDLAESFLLWLAVRHQQDRISTQDFNLITQTIPNRLNYLDEIDCNLFPVQLDNITAIQEFDKQENNFIIYPNPTTDIIRVKLNNEHNFQAMIYNSVGEVVLSSYLKNNQKIDLASFPKGLYILELHKNGELIREKIMKF